MKTSLFFIARRVFAWIAMFVVFLIFWTSILNLRATWPLFAGALLVLVFIFTTSTSHLRRIRLIAGNADASTLANRQRRQIEMPFEADEAFDIIDATIRELPRANEIESARDSLQVRAKVQRVDPYGAAVPLREQMSKTFGMQRDLVFATVTPREGASSVTVICEPETGAWSDLFVVDDGVNLENAEAITRAISRRIAERRRNEQASTKETVTEKELAVAKLGLLHAQVEPHFLYNTLGSAKYLISSDPVRAEEMLDNLILYLRHSLPRTEGSLSTIADELERARAYLDILQIRMGARLRMQIEVPDALKTVPFPTMMLQTLVENSIKHGLEPKTGGGTIWILARSNEHGVAVTVADDGRGFSSETAGTGIGLKNVRERLKLAYGGEATFSIVANFPAGVAATITVPAAGPKAEPKEVNHG